MITFSLPEGALERVAFAYSPLVEEFFSLDVVTEPKHHPLQHAWVRSFHRLKPTLKRAIASFAFFFHPNIPGPITAFPTGEYPTFESELARLLALDDETVRYEFAAAFVFANVGGVEPPKDREHWYSLARANADALNVSELASLVLESPRALMERFCATL